MVRPITDEKYVRQLNGEELEALELEMRNSAAAGTRQSESAAEMARLAKREIKRRALRRAAKAAKARAKAKAA